MKKTDNHYQIKQAVGSLLRHLFFNFFSNSNKNIKISENKKNKANLYCNPLAVLY
jgi:hypothetical protein